MGTVLKDVFGVARLVWRGTKSRRSAVIPALEAFRSGVTSGDGAYPNANVKTAGPEVAKIR